MDEELEREIHDKIAALSEEHRDLDQMIARVSETAPFDQLQIQRMKKRNPSMDRNASSKMRI